MINLLNKFHDLLDNSVGFVDFLAPLLLRIYLVPIFWMAGTQKLDHFSSTISWFGDGLGLPLPWLMASLATATELGGAILLALGLATRWISIPLMVTMLVAMVTVHLKNGWLAIAAGAGPFATERTIGGVERLAKARELLREYGNYEWLIENGPLVILNNGIEFATTYFLMLLALLVLGGGKYFSVDHWIARRFRKSTVTP